MLHKATCTWGRTGINPLPGAVQDFSGSGSSVRVVRALSKLSPDSLWSAGNILEMLTSDAHWD